jgi:hypothetical protein
MEQQGRDALMIARGFKSVIWVAAVGGAALGCYMVSLRVATERNELAKVERQIIAAKQDIRTLQTELGTRGRMTQLEHWNAEVLALSAPSSSQYLENEFTLARLDRPQQTVEDRTAEVRLASAEVAPAPAAPPVVQAAAPSAPPAESLVRRASFSTVAAEAKPKPEPAKATAPAKTPAPAKVTVEAKPEAKAPTRIAATSEAAPARAAKPAPKPEADKPARLGKKLAQELGAAARVEKAKKSGGD